MFTVMVTTKTVGPMVVWDKKDSQKMGDREKTFVMTRTGKGEGADGVAFEPYDPSYALDKGSTKVTLRLTGKMLGSIKVRAGEYEAIVTVGTDYAKYVHSMRPFMGLLSSDLKTLMDMVGSLYAAHAQKAQKSGGGKGPLVSPR